MDVLFENARRHSIISKLSTNPFEDIQKRPTDREDGFVREEAAANEQSEDIRQHKKLNINHSQIYFN
jgi:hypothetical protein